MIYHWSELWRKTKLLQTLNSLRWLFEANAHQPKTNQPTAKLRKLAHHDPGRTIWYSLQIAGWLKANVSHLFHMFLLEIPHHLRNWIKRMCFLLIGVRQCFLVIWARQCWRNGNFIFPGKSLTGTFIVVCPPLETNCLHCNDCLL